MKEIRPYLVVFSAVLSFFSFPPFPFGPLMLISLVPLILAVEDIPPYRAFKFGFLWGMVFHLGLLYYIGWVTVPGMIATVLILALLPATTLWIYNKLISKNKSLAVLFIPAYFLMWNWLLTKSDLNYPWIDFGYALGYYPTLIQAAEIGGVYLITLLVFVINLLVYVSVSDKFEYSEKGRANLRYLAVAFVLAFFIYGLIRVPQLHDPPRNDEITVGLIQGNVTKDLKWEPGNLSYSFDRYFDISRQAVRDGAKLLIWPETAIPTYLVQEPPNMARMRAFVDSIGVPVLTGIVYYETVAIQDYNVYNSAILLTPHQEKTTIYHKMHLVPMSEKLPFSEHYRKLRQIRLGQADFSSGQEQTIFRTDSVNFATLICFESVFPGYTRSFARKGAEMLVVITNDMWFGRTSLFEQHAMMAVFRAIENRIPVVRAANTGISLAVDKRGRIIAKSPIFKEDYLIVKVRPEASRSVYNRIGDVIPQAATVIAMISMVIAFWRRKEYIERQYAE
ncbi:MAG TPA: apolipoprotein N-acyltransferase [candidate division Zixibacteria bacterium]|nr:apolipoprotein N-acyltransferase [candidate division Zixibacteria bacterium]HBZ01445.1 apolipoprotein N-acyltransferase [candidate division Zixibacteria bacterium]